MEDCEYRSQWGTPDLTSSPVTRPRVTVRNEGGAPSNTRIDAPTNVDNSTNKALPWVAIAMLLAGFSMAIAVWSISEARDAHTQLLLLREDIRQMTIEAVKHGKD